ncbi:MAG: serine hydroxymethyltransferase, partial [Hyphomicrobiales bacterium]
MTGGGGPSGEVYFEFTQLGGQMRVAAIDVETAIEVIVIAPLSATKG